jgi:hypothetical protein
MGDSLVESCGESSPCGCHAGLAPASIRYPEGIKFE